MQRRALRPRAATLGAALAAGIAVVVAPAPVTGMQGASDATCRFDAASGALSLRASRSTTRIQRSGDEIRFIAGQTSVPCGATLPTVENVDSITVVSNAEFAIDLRNGPFAPGLTPEDDGSSEIEIRGMFRTTGGARVRGTSRADRIQMGTVDGRRAINLDAREQARDADVVITGGFVVVSVIGRGGADRIKATGGRGFDAPLDAPIAVSAGPGRDRVVGSSGRDLIGGGAGNDSIDPRTGRDRVRTQGGADRLRLKDRTRDRATCGRGNDRVRADRIDRLAGCEKV